MNKEYNILSKYYDLLHREKNYKAEALFFINLIKKNKKSTWNTLLDVACGTGRHLEQFKKEFICEGKDLSKDLINIAKKRNPWLYFTVEDMRQLTTQKKYDIITILFNSIAYLNNKKELKTTLSNIYKILNKNGILLIETLFLTDTIKNIKTHIREYSWKTFSIKRIIDTIVTNDIANLKAKYTIKIKGQSKKEIIDKQKIPLYSQKEMKQIIEDEGFKVKIYHYNPTWTTIFIGIK